ncbi:hypothetical protein MRX96_009378 [Rhipicephalus microplus]
MTTVEAPTTKPDRFCSLLQHRRSSWPLVAASSPKKLSRWSSPLIHHYRLANADGPVRLPRSAFSKRLGSRALRSVSFHAPVQLSTQTKSDVKFIKITPPPQFDRTTEYRVILVSVTAVTLAITILQPLLLFHFLMQCREPRCYKPSIAIRNTLEPSFAPCYDFYKYACSRAGSNHYTKAHDTLRISALHLISTRPTTSSQSSVEKAAKLLRNFDDEYAEFLSQNVFTSLDPIKVSAYVGLYIVWFLSPLASHNLAHSTYVANCTDSSKDVWPRCFSDVHQLMPFAAERLYLQNHLKRSDVEHVEDMVQRIFHSSRDFVTSLQKASEGSETRMVNTIVALGLIPTRLPRRATMANWTGWKMPHLITVYNNVHLGLDSIMPPIDKSFSLNYAVIGHSVVQQGVYFRLHQCTEEEVPVPEAIARGAEVERQQYTKAHLGKAVVTAEILFNAYKGFRQMPQNAAHFRQEAAQFGLTPEQLFFVGLCMKLVSTQRRAA